MYWTIDGRRISCVGNCYEVSTFGLSVEASKSIPVGTRVMFYLAEVEEGAEATVCHCRKHGTWYRIGLRFTVALLPVFQ
jgi:hypothetical protein